MHTSVSQDGTPWSYVFEHFVRFSGRLLARPNRHVVGATACFFISFLFAFPKIQYATNALGIPSPAHVQEKYAFEKTPYYWGGWDEFMAKVRSPFDQSSAPGETHEAKNAFRLTIPVIANVANLTPGGIILLQMAVGWLFFYLLLRQGETVFGDPHVTLWTSLGFATIYAGYSGPVAFSGKMDSFAYFFLLSAMMFSSRLSIFAATQLACWTDERAVLASGLVYLWWRVRNSDLDSPHLKRLLPLDRQSRAVAVAVVAYVAGRLALQTITGLHTPTGNVGVSTFLKLSEFWWVGTWSFFRGMWLPVSAGCLLLHHRREFVPLAAFVLLLAVLTIGAFCVYDITRSGAYAFPAVLISILLLRRAVSVAELRQLAFVSLIISCLSGPLYLIAGPSADSWAFKAASVSDKPFVMQVFDYLYYYVL